MEINMARCLRDPRRAMTAPITNCELFSALSIPQYRLRPYALGRGEGDGARAAGDPTMRAMLVRGTLGVQSMLASALGGRDAA
jgi:hypothetical protein